jgi:hypothetical protein
MFVVLWLVNDVACPQQWQRRVGAGFHSRSGGGTLPPLFRRGMSSFKWRVTWAIMRSQGGSNGETC